MLLWIRYFFANRVINDDPQEALKLLQEYSPMPTSSAITEPHNFGDKFDLAVIVPAYNAEKWINQCMGSIVNQKASFSLQIIVVNDGSTDDTLKLLKPYATDERIEIIDQENKGYSGARNVAIRKVNSKYIMFVDSDDYLPENSVQLLMETATRECADIVEGNGFTFNETGVTGKIKRDNATLWGGPCLKVIRSSLFERIEFPEGYVYEDTIIGALIKPQAKKIVFLPDDVYAYRIHENSVTQKVENNPNRIHSFWIMLLMKEDAKRLGLSKTEFCDSLMGHIVITKNRCRELPENIQRAVFAATRHFLDDSDKAESKLAKKMLKAIKNGKYERYKVLCRLWK